MMNYNEKMRRVNNKFDKGIMDAVVGIYKPGWTYGVFRDVYHKGHKQGSKMRQRLTNFKTK